MKFTLLIATLFLFSTTSAGPDSVSLPRAVIIKLRGSTPQTLLHDFVSVYNKKPTVASNPLTIKYTYNSKHFNAVAGKFSDDFIQAFKKEHKDSVEYVEEDGTMWALAAVPKKQSSQPSPPSWGLTRVSERKLNLSKPYVYPTSAGAGVSVYVVDTGVQDTHKDFGGRAKLIKSFVTGETNTDMNGHGTHCSGTIASATFGIAKKASLFGVKVLNGQGSGTYSDVIAGINYVTGVVKAGKTVMSMSLGGPKSQAVDDAIVAAIKAGVVVIVAAGNNAGDACTLSPSGAAGVLAVGATDNTDKIAAFSNKGKCVGIFGPGVDITSLWKGADGATNKISGTSMATPHVAGVAALLMADKSYAKVADVYAALKSVATKGVVQGLDATTVNLLLNNNVDGQT